MVQTAEETMHDGRELEKKLTLLKDPNAKSMHPIHGELVHVVGSVDMGWNKRSSGRRYDSPSGVSHCISSLGNKIILSQVMIRVCNSCTNLEEATAALEKFNTKYTNHNSLTCVASKMSLTCDICIKLGTMQKKSNDC